MVMQGMARDLLEEDGSDMSDLELEVGEIFKG